MSDDFHQRPRHLECVDYEGRRMRVMGRLRDMDQYVLIPSTTPIVFVDGQDVENGAFTRYPSDDDD